MIARELFLGVFLDSWCDLSGCYSCWSLFDRVCFAIKVPIIVAWTVDSKGFLGTYVVR